jgi:hypothetical protein
MKLIKQTDQSDNDTSYNKPKKASELNQNVRKNLRRIAKFRELYHCTTHNITFN